MDFYNNNYIYVSTADGLFDASNSNYGDSFLKLDTDLNLASSFTPSDYVNRWNSDLDLGSAGEMLVPDLTLPAPYDHMVIKGDKVTFKAKGSLPAGNETAWTMVFSDIKKDSFVWQMIDLRVDGKEVEPGLLMKWTLKRAEAK